MKPKNKAVRDMKYSKSLVSTMPREIESKWFEDEKKLKIATKLEGSKMRNDCIKERRAQIEKAIKKDII